jgi:hypothetical protein
MATILDKKIIRLSTEKVGEKEILVILNNDQTIELKLKSSRGSGKVISILELYEQLNGVEIDKPSMNGSSKITNNGEIKMISLYDLRSHNAISLLPIGEIAKFDSIIKSVIEDVK